MENIYIEDIFLKNEIVAELFKFFVIIFKGAIKSKFIEKSFFS